MAHVVPVTGADAGESKVAPIDETELGSQGFRSQKELSVVSKSKVWSLVKGYIGSREPLPHGTAGIMFIAHFFYKLWRGKCSAREAWEQAASYDKDSRLYVYWNQDGGHWFGYVESVCTAETFRPHPSEPGFPRYR